MQEDIEDKLDIFFSKYKNQKYKQRDVLIRADENPNGVFFLKKGTVKMYVITKNGDELVLNIFKPLSFFPMSYALTNKPNIYFYESVTDADVWKAPKEDVLKFIRLNPDVMLDLLTRLYSGIEGLLMRLSYLMSANAHERLIVEILIYIKRFHKNELQNGIDIHINITEKELANLTGLTRETVSRELKSLKNKGLITFVRRKLTVHNLRLLEAEI